MTKGAGSGLARFQALIRRADELGIFGEFMKAYKRHQLHGVEPVAAGEMALAEAMGMRRDELLVTLATREGKA